MRTRHITRIVSKPNPSVIRPNNRYGRHKLSRTMFIVGCCDWSCGNVNTCVWLMASVITLQLFIVAVMHITRIIPPSPPPPQPSPRLSTMGFVRLDGTMDLALSLQSIADAIISASYYSALPLSELADVTSK